MPEVELAMEGFQPMQKGNISGPRSFAPGRSSRCRCVESDRERQELSFRGSPESSTNPGVQEPNDRLQHVIGSKGVAPMDAKRSPVQAEHHRLVRVDEDALDVPETERLKSGGKIILEQKALPRCRAYPLSRFCHNP
jgi:hypothetical protein